MTKELYKIILEGARADCQKQLRRRGVCYTSYCEVMQYYLLLGYDVEALPFGCYKISK